MLRLFTKFQTLYTIFYLFFSIMYGFYPALWLLYYTLPKFLMIGVRSLGAASEVSRLLSMASQSVSLESLARALILPLLILLGLSSYFLKKFVRSASPWYRLDTVQP